MKTIAIISRKGGASKTTLAVHLADALQLASGKPATDERSSSPEKPQPSEQPKLPPSRQGKKAIAGHFDFSTHIPHFIV